MWCVYHLHCRWLVCLPCSVRDIHITEHTYIKCIVVCTTYVMNVLSVLWPVCLPSSVRDIQITAHPQWLTYCVLIFAVFCFIGPSWFTMAHLVVLYMFMHVIVFFCWTWVASYEVVFHVLSHNDCLSDTLCLLCICIFSCLQRYTLIDIYYQCQDITNGTIL